MKKIIISLTFCFLFFITLYNNTIYASAADIDFLNIKIGPSIDLYNEFALTSDSGFNFYKSYDRDWPINSVKDNIIKARLNFAGDIDILSTNDELLYAIPGDGSVIIGPGSIFQFIIKVDKNNYRDYITFISRDNKLSLINHIQLENYLYGVIPKEMPASWPIESLKAQAVASRSFAVANMNKHIKEGFNLCDGTDCQVYKAYDNEHPNTNRAVNETRGIYAYYNGKVANTTYHSTSGGYTEDSSIAWGGSVPYLIAIEDIYSAGESAKNWSIKMTPSEISNKLLSSGINIGQVQDIEISKTSDSNRVLELNIVGSLGAKIIKGNQLRTIFGNTIIKSTLFNIDKVGDSSTKKIYVIDGSSRYPVEIQVNSAYILDSKGNIKPNRSIVNRAISNEITSSIGESMVLGPASFVFTGKGYGHGVGMSQHGAMEMAKLGFNYEDIIKHYYSGVDIININGDN